MDKDERGLGDRVLRLRQARGETQAEFADVVGVTQPMVSAFEGERSEPSSAAYLRLGSLSWYPDNKWFLEKAGISADVIAAVGEAILKDRTPDSKLMQGEGKIVLVPPFTQGEWERQMSLPPIPVSAEDVLNRASTFYVIATAWGNGFAPRDKIIFDALGAMQRVAPFDGADVVTYTRQRPHPGQRAWDSGEPRGSISIGRIRVLRHAGATHVLFTNRDRSEDGLAVHTARVLASFVHPDTYAASHGTANLRHGNVHVDAEHSAAADDLILEEEEILGQFVDLINGRSKKRADQWGGPQVETFEAWLNRTR
ncbi:MAG TPA: helix-turn-helix transcriptional regulator [Terriglobia bacterium]|nr:helix-turn-helix transcriptional regulator [Terriglobia bacterium]